MAASSIHTHPIHLGLGAVARGQPAYDGSLEWYEAYARRSLADGAEGRLVNLHRFDRPWQSWEMHPHGDEIVLCLSGALTLHQEMADGAAATITLGPGEYAINPRGAWHTADVEGEAEVLFITAGLETTHRPR